MVDDFEQHVSRDASIRRYIKQLIRLFRRKHNERVKEGGVGC